MIPSMFIVLRKTSTHEYWKNRLPDTYPILAFPEDRSAARHFDAPSHRNSKAIASNLGCCSRNQSRSKFGENFFELGGHSLLIAQVVSQIRSIIGVDIPLRSLFDYPNIESLSEAIDTLLWTKKENIASSEGTSSNREKFEI